MTKPKKPAGYHDAFSDAYKFMRTFYHPAQNTPEQWGAVNDAAMGIYRKYENTPAAGFVKAVLFAVMTELERYWSR